MHPKKRLQQLWQLQQQQNLVQLEQEQQSPQRQNKKAKRQRPPPLSKAEKWNRKKSKKVERKQLLREQGTSHTK